MIDRFFDKVRGESIADIQQIGIVEIEAGISEITTFHTHVFIIFDSIKLKFESINQYSKLLFRTVEEIKFEIEVEEEMIPVKSSIAEIVLNDTMGDNRVSSIDIYGLELNDDKNYICDAISLHLACGQELFFDPTYLFGINIGGQRQKNLWMENFPNSPSKSILKKSIELI